MPNQCMKCNKVYPDGSEELLKGCMCGSKFFFFIKQDAPKKIHEITKELSPEDKIKLEKDVLDIIGEIDEEEESQPVLLNLETIKVLEPGKYQIGLRDIFKGKPLVYKLEEGKYIIDIATTFSQKHKEQENKKEPKEQKDIY